MIQSQKCDTDEQLDEGSLSFEYSGCEWWRRGIQILDGSLEEKS